MASHLPRDALLAGLALVPLTALIPLGTGALRGFHRAIDAQFQDALLRPAIFAVLLFASMHFASSSMDALSAIELQVASGVLALLAVGVSVVVHLPPKLRRVPVSRDGRRWAASAVPMAGTELLRIIDGQVPILLLGVLVTLSDVGIYRVASAIAAFVALPATLINLVVMSHVAQLHGDGNRVQLQKVLVSAALVPFVASVATTLGLFFVGRQAIEILFGQAFVPAWGPLCIASAAWCVNAFFGCGATLLNMCGKERALVVTFLLSTIFNLVLIGLLAPTFGAMGVAISLLCVETFRGVAVWLVGRRMLGVDCSLLGALSYVPSIARRAARSKRAT